MVTDVLFWFGLVWFGFIAVCGKHAAVWYTTRRHVLKWIKMCILKGYININFLYVLEYLTFSMCVYYFLCSDKFCVEKSIWICQALNFMERKLSGPFWSMSGFTTGLLLLIHSLSGEKGKLFPCVLDWFLTSAERLRLAWWIIIVFMSAERLFYIIFFIMEPIQFLNDRSTFMSYLISDPSL